jgi:hypothetical protein
MDTTLKINHSQSQLRRTKNIIRKGNRNYKSYKNNKRNSSLNDWERINTTSKSWILIFFIFNVSAKIIPHNGNFNNN